MATANEPGGADDGLCVSVGCKTERRGSLLAGGRELTMLMGAGVMVLWMEIRSDYRLEFNPGFSRRIYPAVRIAGAR
jgi:hypothetical protein